jgi:hypothetical protein
MMKHQLKYSRRTLMKALGVGAALIPLIESDPADAACLVSGIKRLYILVWPNGMLSGVSSWATNGDTPDAWQLPPFQSSLQAYKNELLLLNGIDYDFIHDQPGVGERDGHACFPGMLTGAFYQTLSASTSSDIAGGPSVDQYIGSALRAAGYPGLTSLNLGVFVRSTARLSWKAAGQAVIPNSDPYNVFSTYFAGPVGTAPTPGPGVDPNLVQRGVLDFVSKDLNRFMGVVSTADKQTIQKHLDFVRSIEQQLSAPSMAPGGPTTSVNGDCSAPVFQLPNINVNSTVSVPAVTQMQMDLAVAAFGADLTRVVVMQIGDQAAANLVLTNLFPLGGPNPADPNTGDINGYLSIAHSDGANKVVCDTWFQSQLAYMVGRLASVADASGKSLLDNCAVVAMNNMRSGAGETTGVPVVMAGSCGGYFKTGRSLALTGTPNNQLLVALCNAMGTPVQTFGETRYGGELTVLRS